MNYEPNFNDPRIINRIKTALGFACAVMSETKSHEWSSRYIDKFFGKSSNQLSKYLREKLLICTDQYYRFNSDENKCKEYKLNKVGVLFLKNHINFSNTSVYPSVLQVTTDEFKLELTSGNFTYSDKSDRLWHPLQRYRRNYKKQILSDFGYTHQYDIQCCAPTLIYQYSQHLGMDEYLFALNQYLSNRTQVRNDLSIEMDLPPEAIKEIINALFAGAVISNNEYSDIYHILNGDTARIEYLKQNPYIIELRSNIKTCWEYINPCIQRRRSVKSNRLVKITSRQKWNVYFELERQVINSIRNFLDMNSYRYFLEHDGWSCDKEINQNDLRTHVRNHTGFDLVFEYERTSN